MEQSVKERPILFSGPMVRALLDGRKTQTRRVVNPQPIYGDVAGMFASWMFKKRRASGHWLYPNARDNVLGECPHGQPGDRLWVRETWNWEKNAIGAMRDEDGPFAYAASPMCGSSIDGKWRPSNQLLAFMRIEPTVTTSVAPSLL